MPGLSFTLPHWLYWVGLIVFPLIAMALSRRPRPEFAKYSVGLGYMTLVTGGIIGLHRFYLKSKLGLVFLPLFALVLISNGLERDARGLQSDADNLVRVATRTLEREEPRLVSAEAAIGDMRIAVAEAEADSFAKKSAERSLKRTEGQIVKSRDRIEQSRIDLKDATPLAAETAETRQFWSDAARYAFYALMALVAIDAVLMISMVKKANANLVHTEKTEMDVRLEEADAAEARKPDHEYAENWIDRLSLFCGEFVSYWAVIAVFVYYYEVIARYVFNSPTNWAHESMYLMFGMQYLIAGSYAMLTETHVRVDIFYAPLPKKRKAIVDLATTIFFFIFAGTLLFTSYTFAMDSIGFPAGNSVVSDWARGDLGFFEMLGSLSLADWTDPNIRWGEFSFNEWNVPLWPMKWVMVLGGLLLVLQGFSKLSKDVREVLRGN